MDGYFWDVDKCVNTLVEFCKIPINLNTCGKCVGNRVILGNKCVDYKAEIGMICNTNVSQVSQI